VNIVNKIQLPIIILRILRNCLIDKPLSFPRIWAKETWTFMAGNSDIPAMKLEGRRLVAGK
jgi:hypothetical protein